MCAPPVPAFEEGESPFLFHVSICAGREAGRVEDVIRLHAHVYYVPNAPLQEGFAVTAGRLPRIPIGYFGHYIHQGEPSARRRFLSSASGLVPPKMAAPLRSVVRIQVSVRGWVKQTLLDGHWWYATALPAFEEGDYRSMCRSVREESETHFDGNARDAVE